jgi:predicted NUDIX family NTP pyrophosphohydrolase
MPVLASGILLYREKEGKPEVLLIHPGGPFYKNKDAGIWSVPKGIRNPDEDPLVAAIREFSEETGAVPVGPYVELPEVRYGSGKRLTVFACRGDLDLKDFKSNEFELEWPPKSGKTALFPEADKAGWFDVDTARIKMLPAQQPLLPALLEILK